MSLGELRLVLYKAVGFAVVLTVAFTVLSEYAQSRRAYVICAVVLTVAFTLKRRHARWFYMAERGLSRIAQWRRLSTTLVGLLALAGSAITALCTHMPVPIVHDEFKYLDRCFATFSSRRSKKHQWGTVTQNVEEFTSRYLATCSPQIRSLTAG